MTPVFPQVCGDTIRPCFLAEQGCRHRIGFVCLAGLAQGSDVVHIDVQPRRRH
jgi:hypothetical protein